MVESGPGDTITVNRGEVHDGTPIGDAGRSWRMLYFDPALIADAVCDVSEGKTREYEFALPVFKDAGMARCFQHLFLILTTDIKREATILREQLLLTLLAGAMRGQDKLGREQRIPQAIVHARRLIDDDPTAPITLADLARESGLSQFQVVRAFSKATGLTPHAYLVQRRVHTARRLIANGTPLADAAVTSGFADQSHMTRIFIRKYGVSPRAYADAMT